MAKQICEIDTRAQAKEVILEIVKAADGSFRSKTALYKAFYFAHLYYWRENCIPLTDHPIVKMPAGPGIDEGDLLLQELEAEGKLCITKQSIGPYLEWIFELSMEMSESDELTERERDAIAEAVEFVRGKSATELSEISHDYSRSWHMTPLGEEQNIYVDLMEDTEFARMERDFRKSEMLINELFEYA